MGLANFFDKAALSASQVLSGCDYSAFRQLVESYIVALAFDGVSARSPEGQATLELTVNLLARLYPRIALAPIGGHDDQLTERLVALARSVNPEIEIAIGQGGAQACIAVGSTPVMLSARTIYIGSNGWLAMASSQAPVHSGHSRNPFGAGAAACLGAANVFRSLFSDYLPNPTMDHNLAMSLLHYDPTNQQPPNPELETIDLGESFLVGLGAVGNGAIWALSRVLGLRGTLHLVDGESVEPSNLQRYVLTQQADKEVAKTVLAARMLQTTQLVPIPHPTTWGEYLRSRSDWRLETVAVAVDSARARCEIQASMPRWLVNAWTQPWDLGVSRHDFVGDQACLACLYFPQKEVKSEEQQISEALGLTDHRKEVGRLLLSGEPVDQDLIERVAKAKQVPVESLLAFVGIPLRVLYSRAVCGGVMLRLGQAAPDEPETQAPMAFQSALAGIMLAAEMVAHAGRLKQAHPPVTTKIDLLRPIGKYLNFEERKHPSGRCICQDEDYLRAYHAKYATG